MAQYTTQIQPFPVPTNVQLVMPAGKRQEGMKPAITLSLDQLDAITLAELCDEFTKAVFEAAGKPL